MLSRGKNTCVFPRIKGVISLGIRRGSKVYLLGISISTWILSMDVDDDDDFLYGTQSPPPVSAPLPTNDARSSLAVKPSITATNDVSCSFNLVCFEQCRKRAKRLDGCVSLPSH